MPLDGLSFQLRAAGHLTSASSPRELLIICTVHVNAIISFSTFHLAPIRTEDIGSTRCGPVQETHIAAM